MPNDYNIANNHSSSERDAAQKENDRFINNLLRRLQNSMNEIETLRNEKDEYATTKQYEVDRLRSSMQKYKRKYKETKEVRKVFNHFVNFYFS